MKTESNVDIALDAFRSILERVERDYKLDRKFICPACRDIVLIVEEALRYIARERSDE